VNGWEYFVAEEGISHGCFFEVHERRKMIGD